MQAIGVQIDGDSLQWALVKWDGRRLFLLDWGAKLSSEPVKQLYTKAHSIPLISALGCKDLLLSHFSHSLTVNSQHIKAFSLQAETKLHLPQEELLTIAVEQSKHSVTTYSTHRTALKNHISLYNQRGLNPERIGALPSSLLAFMNWKAPDLDSYFLIDIKQSFSSLLWVENKTVRKAHDISFGYDHLTNAYEEDRKKLISLKSSKQIDFTALKTGQYPLLSEAARIFRRETSKTLHSFSCQKPLIFLGELHKNGPFKEFLLEALRNCVTKEILLDLQPQEKLYAGSAGHAIDYLTQRKTPIQFRNGPYTSTKIWNKLGRYTLGFLTASFLFSTIFHQLAEQCLKKREQALMANIEQWALAQDQALSLSIASFAKKNLQELMNHWVKTVNRNAKPYPFLIKAQKVTPFLQWLFTHPFIVELQKQDVPLDFQQIRYQLESYPHLDALNHRYLVKIELIFYTSNPLHANRFHEALLKDNEMIDSSKEISWDASSQNYKTSFYLKELPYANF